MGIKIVDLFAGAGGLSEGFVHNGADIVSHVEIDKDCCETLITRNIYHALRKKNKLSYYNQYLSGGISRDEIIKKFSLQKEVDSVIHAEIGEKTYRPLIKKIKDDLKGSQLDFVVGGPPCQAYSMIGRARDVRGMKRDKRNYLYKYYIAFLKALKPKIFLFENVPGILSAGGNGKYLKDMRRMMAKIGYKTDYRILNAADYGVPQGRRRIILIGWNKKSKLKQYPNFPMLVRSYKVGDFFSDLPVVGRGEKSRMSLYRTESPLLKKLGIRDGGENVFDHITRSHNERDLSIYSIALERHSQGERLKYNELPSNLKTHKNERAFLDRYKVVDSGAEAAHTVVAHIAKDGHYYIHPDRKQLRSLSVREAARIQTFPDSYRFEGNRTAQFRQIGNAVPPMLAEVIALTLLQYVKE